MANYTSTTLKFTEKIGDSVIGGNMITSGTLTISPKSGYVVTASDFSISTLPDNVTSVVFTDTGTAGTPSNNITVTVTFGPLFTVTAGKTINLDIAGDAKLLAAQDVNLGTNTLVVSLDLNEYPNVTTSMAVSDQPTGATFNVGVVDNTRIHVLTIQNLIANKSTNIAQIKITASSGYYFLSQPTLSFTRLFEPQAPNISLKVNSVTRDSNSRITEYIMDVFFISDVQIPHPSASSIGTNHTAAFINASAKKAVTSTDLIKNIVYGSNQVSDKGDRREIKVYGDVGSQFDLTIIKNSNNTSVMSTDAGTSNADIFHPIAGIIKGHSATIPSRGFVSVIQEFPAGTDTYEIKVQPKGSTTILSTLSPEITISQLADITLNLTASDGSNYTVASPTIRYVGKANHTINQLSNRVGTQTPVRTFDFTYVATKGVSGTKFTTHNNPSWSSTDASASNWTHSVSANNGGTQLEMYNLKTEVNDETTPTVATITGSVRIVKFGNATVTMELTTSDFLTIT
tara:strand:+ start:3770 stop:5311 length:1542 start_codon:yes stop_codon:yes gene_type:complete